jgi:tRNA threonylcarbamoyladenosine biosynthesis protein TsaB
MQLAIDTSTEIASIALSDTDKVVAELTWHCGQNHTVELLPGVEYLCKLAKVSLQNLDGIVVARGPGSYNGLRVGLSTAKGLAFALGIPLVGIPTLEAEAFPFAATALPLCPIHEVGGGELAMALYQYEQDEWRQLHEISLATFEALCSRIETKTLFCGEISLSLEIKLRERLGALAVIPEATARLRRAGHLAQLGWRRLKRGDSDELHALQPIYLRRPAITQIRKRFPAPQEAPPAQEKDVPSPGENPGKVSNLD